MKSFPKLCTCCARVISKAQWQSLPFVGVCMGELELRNCDCGSTLAIPLSPVSETVRPEVRMEAP